MRKQRDSYQKIIQSSIALSLMTGAIVSTAPLNTLASTKQFSDIKNTDHYFESIKDLNDRGILKGYEDNTFRPNMNVTRGQLAKMIALTLNLDFNKIHDPHFIDVKVTDSNYVYIAALANAGIITGFNDKSYKPNSPVTRAQMAKILVRSFNIKKASKSDLPFTDVQLDSEFAPYIQSLYENAITTGKTISTFEPYTFVTRGQVATFITRSEKVKPVEVLSISENHIELSNGTYKIADELKGFINPSNSKVLVGAILKFSSNNGTIDNIKSLEIRASGTTKTNGQLIFNGNNSVFEGNVKVDGDFVTLKNWTVKGKLELASSIQNYFVGQDIKVLGETSIVNQPINAHLMRVAAENNEAEIIFINSLISDIYLNRNSTFSLFSKGKTEINSIKADSNFNYYAESEGVTRVLEIENLSNIALNGLIEKVNIKSENFVQLSGTAIIKQLSIDSILSKNLSLQLGNQIEILDIITPKGMNLESFIKNYKEIIKNIEKINGVKNPDSTPRYSGPSSLELAVSKAKNLLDTLEIDVAGAESVVKAQKFVDAAKEAVADINHLNSNYDTVAWDSTITTQQNIVDLRRAIEHMESLIGKIAFDVSEATSSEEAQQFISDAKDAMNVVKILDPNHNTTAWETTIANQQGIVDLRVAIEHMEQLMNTLALDISRSASVMEAQELISAVEEALASVVKLNASHDTTAWKEAIDIQQRIVDLREKVEYTEWLLKTLESDVAGAFTAGEAQQFITLVEQAIGAVQALDSSYDTLEWDMIISAQQHVVNLRVAIEDTELLIETFEMDVLNASSVEDAQQIITLVEQAVEAVHALNSAYDTSMWNLMISVQQGIVDLRAAEEHTAILIGTLETDVLNASSIEVAQQYIAKVKQAIAAVVILDPNFDTANWDLTVDKQQRLVNLREVVEYTNLLLGKLATDVEGSSSVVEARQFISDAQHSIESVLVINPDYNTNHWITEITTQQDIVNLREAVEYTEVLAGRLATDVNGASSIGIAQQFISDLKQAIASVLVLSPNYNTTDWYMTIDGQQNVVDLRTAVEHAESLMDTLTEDVAASLSIEQAQQTLDEAKQAISAVVAIKSDYDTTKWQENIAIQQRLINLRAAEEHTEALLKTLAVNVEEAVTISEAEQFIAEAEAAIASVMSLVPDYDTSKWMEKITTQKGVVEYRKALEYAELLIANLSENVAGASSVEDAKQFITLVNEAANTVLTLNPTYNISSWTTIIDAQQNLISIREVKETASNNVSQLPGKVANSMSTEEAQNYINQTIDSVKIVKELVADIDTSEWNRVIEEQQEIVYLIGAEDVNAVLNWIEENNLGLINTNFDLLDSEGKVEVSTEVFSSKNVLRTKEVIQNKLNESIELAQSNMNFRVTLSRAQGMVDALPNNVQIALTQQIAQAFIEEALNAVNQVHLLQPTFDTTGWAETISAQQQFIIAKWSGLSREITSLDFQTIQPTSARLVSKSVTDSDFTGNRKDFVIVTESERIPVSFYWKLSADFSTGQSIGGVVESAIQDYYFQKYGVSGLTNRTVMSYGSGDVFNIYSTISGSASIIRLEGNDWSYFFDQQQSIGTNLDNSKNRSFTVSDGMNNAPIVLTRKFNTMNDLVAYMQTQLTRGNVQATAIKLDETHFQIMPNLPLEKPITISGHDKNTFFN